MIYSTRVIGRKFLRGGQIHPATRSAIAFERPFMDEFEPLPFIVDTPRKNGCPATCSKLSTVNNG